MQEVVGDKGFDGDPQRQSCRSLGAKPVLPFKANRAMVGRLNKKAYRERNRIERLPYRHSLRETETDVCGDNSPCPRIHLPERHQEREEILQGISLPFAVKLLWEH